MSEAPAAGRPRRWRLALILNAIFPPTGYAYVGAWRMVWGLVGLWVVAAFVLIEATYRWPPGTYALGKPGILGGAAVIGLALGVHAAWLAHRAPPRTGASKAVLYIVPWILLTLFNVVVRTYGPRPTYEVSSEAMAPTLVTGDIVMTDHPRGVCGEAKVTAGDVVLFQRDGVNHIFRAIAGPGQRVMLSSGQLFVDGKPVGRREVGRKPIHAPAAFVTPASLGTVVEETLANGARFQTFDFEPDGVLDNVREVTVPAGAWYVLGDSRDNATDSRVSGPVPAATICAVVDRVVATRDPARIGQEP